MYIFTFTSSRVRAVCWASRPPSASSHEARSPPDELLLLHSDCVLRQMVSKWQFLRWDDFGSRSEGLKRSLAIRQHMIERRRLEEEAAAARAMASIAPTIVVCLSWCCRSAGGAKTSWCGGVALQSIKQTRYTSQWATESRLCDNVLPDWDHWVTRQQKASPRPCIAYSARTSSGLNLVNGRHGA